ncbi:Os10g0478600 [Oryza sativa Japonica Group]|jgi:hypothetical protein|uniref:Expressed protein n=3 Tax=Oryza sativa TaxID=4530 RepID=Q7XDC4_ORYSJ|nr:expressed protein [Oryza sativa Japonica Group]EEC67174.1 hypothetical protein OsI_34042 [Oryza sativa Indica Group]KAB8113026.1 hypothetical protein EE612_051882 [Oryza sativa]EEE51144.1 hypothetical protein OsJ_31903 [Oryza sativa Japonica Group]BAF26778.1 Os10g0478600 [Oryza sativa Japonica Group]|eukprot:NP_001064864.1 Os10g0478600 [Oryza sativa Japonica Group]
MLGLPSIDGRFRVTAGGGEVGPALQRRSTSPQPAAPSAPSLCRSITVPTSKANRLRSLAPPLIQGSSTLQAVILPANKDKNSGCRRKIQADRTPCQLLLFAAQSRKFLADSTKFLFGIGNFFHNDYPLQIVQIYTPWVNLRTVVESDV